MNGYVALGQMPHSDPSQQFVQVCMSKYLD